MRWNIIKWEKKNGYKGKFIADKLGIAYPTWSNIKRGRTEPNYKMLCKFQEEFNHEDVLNLFKDER